MVSDADNCKEAALPVKESGSCVSVTQTGALMTCKVKDLVVLADVTPPIAVT